MRTLFVLHSMPIFEERILEYIRSVPGWTVTRASTTNGQSKEYFWAEDGRDTIVALDTWSVSEMNAFRTLRPWADLVSPQLEEQEYEDVNALLKSRSVRIAASLDQRQ